MSTFTNTAREVEMPNGDVVVIHNAPTGGENTTSNIKKFKYDDNGHVTESTAADAEDLNLSGYSTPTTGTTAIGASDDVQTAIGKLDHQSQIDQTNILYSLQTGVKNIIKPNTINSWANMGFTVVRNSDGSITVSGTRTTSGSTWIEIGSCTASSGIYYLSGGTSAVQLCITDASGAKYNTNTDYTQLTTPIDATMYIHIPNSTSSISGSVTIYPMICTKAAWDQEPNVFRPFALPNSDLTYLEAEDRAALAEVVDSGAKNLFDWANSEIATYNPYHATVSKTDLSFTITSTDVSASYGFVKALPKGEYVLTTTISNFSGLNKCQCVISVGSRSDNIVSGYTFTGNCNIEIRFDLTQTSDVYINYYANVPGNPYVDVTSYTASNLMICTKAAFGVSPKFVPYGNDPFYQVPINHNMIYRGRNLGATLTDAQHTALSGGNFTDLYLGDYWTKTVTIPAFYEVTTAEPSDWSTNYTSYYTKSGDTYTPVSGDTAPTWAANTYYERLVPAQTVTLKAVIADFDTFYAGYASGYAAINSHHAAVVVHGFNNVVWNKTNTTAGGYVNSLIHKWLVNSALPQIETWFGSAKVLSHQKLLTNAITGDAASGWAWSSQKISLLSENQMYGSKVWGNSKASNGGYEPGEAFKHLNVFNHIDANLLFGNRNIWLRDIASAVWAADLSNSGFALSPSASSTEIAPAALILLS